MAYFPLLKKLPLNFDVLIPFYQFDNELVRELELSKIKVVFKNDRVVVVEPLTTRPVWAQDWWPQCQAVPYETKSQVLKVLKSQPVRGHYYESTPSKFAKGLIQELRDFPKKRIDLNSQFNFNYYGWTAFEDGIIICEKPFSRFPEGWHEFNEDKEYPPNRAYLKLWELLTVYQLPFDKEQTVIDLGSSPGGWSWVLSQFFNKVHSVDRAELDPKIQKISNIHHFQEDAFKVKPQEFKDCSWVFSDIICTPQRSYELMQNWMTNGSVENFVCTLKFKGDCDFDIMKKCAEVKGTRLIRLYQNKNEVTWVRFSK